MHTLTFLALRLANLRRLPLFKNGLGLPAHSEPDGSDWSIAEWTNAIAGEAGEACNLAKKLIRGDFGAPGSDPYKDAMYELAKELADIVTYADITCHQTGYDLGAMVATKFNEVSQRVGCDVHLELERPVKDALRELLQRRSNDTYSCRLLATEALALLDGK